MNLNVELVDVAAYRCRTEPLYYEIANGIPIPMYREENESTVVTLSELLDDIEANAHRINAKLRKRR
jgi:hypothetical protein